MDRPLSFKLVAICSTTKARASLMKLRHSTVELPVFMPVGTQASLKGISPDQLSDLGCRLMLNNTYHLGLKPGQEVLDAVGGAHSFQGWAHSILTDSGGFQMVSLLKLAHIMEEGVRFLSPHDGSPMLLTPEHSMNLQNSIGSDIIMQLDDVAMLRSVRWLDRCIKAHKKPETQALFAIIQGGLDERLRRLCCEKMVERDTPGIAIGGLSGGEEKPQYCKIVSLCTDLLPKHKPRYVMGVGYAEDLMVSVALGADMFDCVYPTRTARFGNALTPKGVLNLKNRQYASDFRPIDSECTCPCCAKNGWKITRAYVYHLAGKETVGAHLLTLHNLHYQFYLMREARKAIIQDRFPQYLRDFFSTLYEGRMCKYPRWAVEALRTVNVDLIGGQSLDILESKPVPVLGHNIEPDIGNDSFSE
ncbi:putative queuine tRNA-ribosyltransferase [Neolecta irregularis DAH-3]|uniref:Queuine tRNA-ribosyltransferase catalytic subunit 1 n=1 Tax=Neolecta irregularis (strain DAH-3) TaxID=1198029 RepID=A0A1U7LH44_NEOID|nr:putative queuine tRNA-ribosyltransferase [Neolecta irregularis DAH-3]|eukprot:OLL21948.1 putative queuine tRNA-ribosyltransferase [Neolecta irregularis DAH-3]